MAHIQNVRLGPSWLSRPFHRKYSSVHSSGNVNPPTWRPWPLRAPYFMSFIFLCTLLILAIEGIILGCSGNGCPILGTMSTTDVSRQSNLAYNLVPTAIGLAVGILWAVPHHDIMRLEPYFQMSSKDVGATANDSLLLKYSYTFAPLVPFISGKRRHHVVLLSSCILLLMNFFITPLISSIFDPEMLEKNIADNGAKRLLYRDHATRNTTSSFAYQAYSYLWLERPLPPFTTPTYALLPVQKESRLGNETWSAATTMYKGGLTCEAATVNWYSTEGDDFGHITKLGGNNSLQFCSEESADLCSLVVSFLRPWTIVVGLPSDNSDQDAPLASPFRNGPQTYLIAWSHNRNLARTLYSLPESQQPRNTTALACTTSFYSQPVTATFGGSGIVLNISTTGKRTPFLDTESFTAAISGEPYTIALPSQYMDASGNLGLGFIPPVFPDTSPPMLQNIGLYTPDLNVASEEFDKMMGPVVAAGMTGLAGFALYNETPDTLEKLLNPKALAESFENAFQILFAFWVALELIGDDQEVVPTMRHVWARGFTINLISARSVQGGLVVISLLIASLCVLLWQRRCELDGEPNSLAEGLQLLSDSPELTQCMENSEFHKIKDISQRLGEGGRRYLLKLIPGKGSRVQVVVADSAKNTQSTNQQILVRTPPTQEPAKPQVEELWSLKTYTGIGFVTYFGAILAFLITVFTYAQGHQGLPSFVPINSPRYKLLFNHIPIIVSMSIEPILITISTGHCMLGPYMPLIRGSASSAMSLVIDYDKSPPQFQLLCSSYWRNVTTAALAILVLLSNAIAITFSGLFSPIETLFSTEIDVVSPASLNIIGNFTQPAEDMYYILSANLTEHIPAPNWTTSEYYILPFFPVDSSSTIYEGETWGVGIEVECKVIKVDQMPETCVVQRDPLALKDACQDGYTYSIIVNDPCWFDKSWFFSPVFTSDEFLYLSYICRGTLFAGWTQTLPLRIRETTVLKCTSQDSFVKLKASVNQEQVNSISEIQQMTPPEIASMYHTNSTDNRQLSQSFANALWAAIDIESSTTKPLTWINHLMVALEPSINQNGSYVTHIPNTTNLAQTFAGIYRRLFVINLSLCADEIVSVQRNNTIPAKGEIRTNRVQMNKLMFAISAGILSLIIVVLALFYGYHRQQLPGHLPTTLAGVYAHLYASNLGEDCDQIVGMNPKIRAQRLAELNKLYRFGEFKGKDGTKHVGVYQVDKEEVVENE